MLRQLPHTLLVAAFVFAPSLTLAQMTHEPLPVSETLDFATILQSALTQAPESREAAVRADQATAFGDAAASWMAGRPSLMFNYYDDRSMDNRGQFEANYGVQMPLWRRGERSGSQQLARAYREQTAVWEAAFRLDVTGRVRTALSNLDEATALREIERAATATAQELLRITTAQFEAGAVARLDVMQSENLLLEQRKRDLAAEAALVDAGISYELLTGLSERPALAHTETQSPQVDIPADHPLLLYLQSEVVIADGAIQQSEISAKGNPQLFLGTRRERGDRFTPYTDSVNLTLTIPFGGKGFVSARTSEARRDKVDAEVLHLTTQRALILALHEAEHELSMIADALPLAERQAQLSAERQQLAQQAFAAGELTLAQVVPAVQEARGAARELALLQLQRQRLIIEYNQLIGVQP